RACWGRRVNAGIQAITALSLASVGHEDAVGIGNDLLVVALERRAARRTRVHGCDHHWRPLLTLPQGGAGRKISPEPYHQETYCRRANEPKNELPCYSRFLFEHKFYFLLTGVTLEISFTFPLCMRCPRGKFCY